MLGPGLITGASDDDPSGIGTYSAAGAALGYGPLWTALVTFPLTVAVQFICARIGLVTGRGLAGVLRRHYSPWILYPVVLVLAAANTINAGVDIGAIAAGLELLVPIPAAAWLLPITALILGFQVWGSYRLIARIFKVLTLSLFAYIGSALLAGPDWTQVLRGTLVPTIRLDASFLAMLVALLGTTISPYLFFWQAGQEVEELRSQRRKPLKMMGPSGDGELTIAAWDVGIGMFFSNLVMFFIILAGAATLHRTHQGQNIATAADLAAVLRPLCGPLASLLLTLGLVGTGFLSVPVLTTSAASALSEALRWRNGLNEKPARAGKFYALIGVLTVAGMLLNFVGVPPVTALYWTAVLNGLLAPPLLVIVLLISSNRTVMGRQTNGPVITVLGRTTAVVMAAAALGLLLTWGRT
jgi:NRAMP (natural resistance-associated macrophage protein)-like metal ion transporter